MVYLIPKVVQGSVFHDRLFSSNLINEIQVILSGLVKNIIVSQIWKIVKLCKNFGQISKFLI